MDAKVKELNQLINDYIVKNELEVDYINWVLVFAFILENCLRSFYEKNLEIKREIKNFKQIDYRFAINFIKYFYKKHNIDFDIDKVINDGTILFKEPNYEKDSRKIDGICYWENNRKLVDIYFSGLQSDVIVLLHELSHYRDPISLDSQNRYSILSETLAKAETLIGIETLKEYTHSELDDSIYIFLKSFNIEEYLTAKIYIHVLQMFYLCLTFGDISQKNYELMYGKVNNYEEILSEVEKELNSENFSLEMASSYIIGANLSYLMYTEYKKDVNYYKKIEYLRNKLNDMSFGNCLHYIGIKEFDKETIQKIIDSFNEVINTFLNKEENITRTK